MNECLQTDGQMLMAVQPLELRVAGRLRGSVFFSRELRKGAREQFFKSARELFALARERWKTNLPVNSKSARELLKKCP